MVVCFHCHSRYSSIASNATGSVWVSALTCHLGGLVCGCHCGNRRSTNTENLCQFWTDRHCRVQQVVSVVYCRNRFSICCDVQVDMHEVFVTVCGLLISYCKFILYPRAQWLLKTAPRTPLQWPNNTVITVFVMVLCEWDGGRGIKLLPEWDEG